MDQKERVENPVNDKDIKEENLKIENIDSHENESKNDIKSEKLSNNIEDKLKNLDLKLENNESENSINITKVKEIPKINDIIEKNPAIINSYDLNEDTLKNLRDIGKLFFINKNTKSS